MNKTPVPILMAEDDEDDRLLAMEAFEESKLLNRLYIVEDGEELLDFLYHRGVYTD
ncbi:MAG: response regulator, partial [Okeania sp. SIO3C4]|nr:response regulator [Okeania sp. SIO3C4]